jgi:hypothetical protein
LVYWFAKIFVEKTSTQTDEKSQWCHIFENGGSEILDAKLLGNKFQKQLTDVVSDLGGQRVVWNNII